MVREFEKQLEVMDSLEKEVSSFIDDKMLSPELAWQPSDFLPDFADPDFKEKVLLIQDEIANVPDTVMVSLVGNMITEEALPSYQTYFNSLEGVNTVHGLSNSNAWAKWSRLWTAEENRHGDLLNKYLYLTGRVDMKAVEKTIQRLIYNGFDAQADGDPYQGLVYTSFQERATKISHVNTGKLAFKAGDSSLSKVCSTIAGEEAKHEKAYKFFMSKVFEVDPNGALAAFEKMMRKKIAMPATLMDANEKDNKYINFSNITQKIGVYTSRDYAAIIEHLVSYWNIGKLTSLNEIGKKAQDYLGNLSERYFKLAERIKEPEEVSLIWLKNSNPFIHA